MNTAAGFDRRPFGKRGVRPEPTPAPDRRHARRTTRSLLAVTTAGVVGLIVVVAASQFHGNSERVAALQQAPAAEATAQDYSYIPVCSGGNRRARRVTCLVDGDTGWEHGVKWRLLSIDTPEISKPGCAHEYSVAIAARDRLQALMSSGYSIHWAGTNGYYGRALVRIRLADGRDAGKVLLAEKLAQPWPNSGNIWCGG